MPRLQRHGARTWKSRSRPPATWSTGSGSSSRRSGDAREHRPRLVPSGTRAADGEVHGDLGRRPRRRAAAHIRRTLAGRTPTACAANRRDAAGPPGLGVRRPALHAGRDERGGGPASGDREDGTVPLRPDAAGLLRRRRARPRHGHKRRVGVGELPVSDHRILWKRVLRDRRPRARRRLRHRVERLAVRGVVSAASRANRAARDRLSGRPRAGRRPRSAGMPRAASRR